VESTFVKINVNVVLILCEFNRVNHVIWYKKTVFLKVSYQSDLKIELAKEG